VLSGPEHLLNIPLKRMGECDACANTYPRAWCCSDMSVVVFTTGELDTDLEEFLKMKGMPVSNHRVSVEIRQVCPQYDEKTRKCKVYTKRPKICSEFPVKYDQIVLKDPEGNWHSPCSYYWDLDTEADIEIDLKEAGNAFWP